MKKNFVLAILSLVAIACAFFSCKQKVVPPEKAIAQAVLVQVDSFIMLKDELIADIEKGDIGDEGLQQQFMQTRLAYKRIEWATEYFLPSVSRFVNGPPVQEIEKLDNQSFDPAGLQVIEGYLFPRYDRAHKRDLLEQLKLLQHRCDKYKTFFATIGIFDWQVFDATKLEVFRVMSLGIAGFDDPLSRKSMLESSVALASLQPVLAHYMSKNDTNNIAGKLNAAVDYLKTHQDFNSFNRALFITNYANPVSISIAKLEKQLKKK